MSEAPELIARKDGSYNYNVHDIPHELMPLLDLVMRDFPDLADQISRHSSDWIDILGTIAAYCGVALDGTYMPDEITRLADLLGRRLKQQDSIILLP